MVEEGHGWVLLVEHLRAVVAKVEQLVQRLLGLLVGRRVVPAIGGERTRASERERQRACVASGAGRGRGGQAAKRDGTVVGMRVVGVVGVGVGMGVDLDGSVGRGGGGGGDGSGSVGMEE